MDVLNITIYDVDHPKKEIDVLNFMVCDVDSQTQIDVLQYQDDDRGTAESHRDGYDPVLSKL